MQRWISKINIFFDDLLKGILCSCQMISWCYKQVVIWHAFVNCIQHVKNVLLIVLWKCLHMWLLFVNSLYMYWNVFSIVLDSASHSWMTWQFKKQMFCCCPVWCIFSLICFVMFISLQSSFCQQHIFICVGNKFMQRHILASFA